MYRLSMIFLFLLGSRLADAIILALSALSVVLIPTPDLT